MYDVWVMTRRDDRRVAREEALLPAITRAKQLITPRNFVRVVHWHGATMTVAWDSLDGDSAHQDRKAQLRNFIRRPRKSPAGGLRT